MLAKTNGKIMLRNDEMKILIECLEKNATVKEACREFVERTGSSRRTFFRRKKKLEARREKPRWNKHKTF